MQKHFFPCDRDDYILLHFLQVRRTTEHNENHLDKRYIAHMCSALRGIQGLHAHAPRTHFFSELLLLTQQVLPVLHDNAATHDAPVKQRVSPHVRVVA